MTQHQNCLIEKRLQKEITELEVKLENYIKSKSGTKGLSEKELDSKFRNDSSYWDYKYEIRKLHYIRDGVS